MALNNLEDIPETAPKPSRLKALIQNRSFDVARYRGFTFILVFAFIGSIIVWYSLAATPVIATLDASQMALPAGASVVPNSLASNGQSVRLTESGTSLIGSVNLPGNATSMTVSAYGVKCAGGWPAMSVRIGSTLILNDVAIHSKNWTNYNTTVALNQNVHQVTITDTSKNSCRYLYINDTTFNGPNVITPVPTISFSASPTSISSGSASTLTWNTTNATSCTASGAWGGTKATSGSVSTGALSTNSSYTLSCTGTGGSASASATVTVTPATVGSGGSTNLCESVAIPAYFDPTDSLSPWATATAAKPGIMIANPDNGPGASVNSSYLPAIAAARSAGIAVYGYVDTGYMANPYQGSANTVASIETTINSWKSMYGVTNIFLDDVSSSASLEADYQTLNAFVHSQTNGSLTILNTGDVPDESYMAAGDIINIFEGNYQTYLTTTFPSWIKTYPASRFYNIIYNVPMASDMTETLDRAESNGIEYVYATNQTLPNPYGLLPTPASYLSAETSAAAVNCSL